MPSNRPNTQMNPAAVFIAAAQRTSRELLGASDIECDPFFPNLPKSSLLSRAGKSDQTKPPVKTAARQCHLSGTVHSAPAGIDESVRTKGRRNKQCHSSDTAAVGDEPSQTFQKLPESSVACHAGPLEKTKPNLPLRQLAAARLLARGVAVGEVAREVGVARQTVAVWKRSGEFVAEVHRLHEMLAMQPELTLAGADGRCIS